MDAHLALPWLLEDETPSPRYLALRSLLDLAETDPQVIAARNEIPGAQPARAILDAQFPAGHWIKPDRGYSPRYRGTVWQIVFLADLGAPRIASVARACEHVLEHALRSDQGLFSAHKHSTGLFPCLNGSLLRALYHFGYGHHPTVCEVAGALARAALSTSCACPRNSPHPTDRRTWQPCTWGCVKTLRGLAAVPAPERTAPVEQALGHCAHVLLASDLAQDRPPTLGGARSHWLRPGFPLGESSDLLEALLALAEAKVRGTAGLLDEPLALVLTGQDSLGRWPLETVLPNTWASFGDPGRPNKWVTLRALTVLRAFAQPWHLAK